VTTTTLSCGHRLRTSAPAPGRRPGVGLGSRLRAYAERGDLKFYELRDNVRAVA